MPSIWKQHHIDCFSSLLVNLYLATCAPSNVFSLSTAWAEVSEEGVASSQQGERSDPFSSGTFSRHTKLGFLWTGFISHHITSLSMRYLWTMGKHLTVLAHSRQHLFISIASCLNISHTLFSTYCILWPYSTTITSLSALEICICCP